MVRAGKSPLASGVSRSLSAFVVQDFGCWQWSSTGNTRGLQLLTAGTDVLLAAMGTIHTLLLGLSLITFHLSWETG